MTPTESELLHNLGNSNLQLVVQLSIAVIFYGMFFVLFAASIVIVMRKGVSNRATAAMFIATAINFLLTSLVVGIEVAIFIATIRKALIVDTDYPLSGKLELVNKVVWKLDIAIEWAGSISMLLSDLIVIWRAWALFPYQRQLILLPFILWIGVAGTGVACCAWSLTPIGPMALTSSSLINILSTTSLALSIATNAAATLLIAYKLWSYRTSIIRTLGLRGPTNSAQTILILLVESGLFYLAIQICLLVLALDRSAINHHAAAFRAERLAAIYPTVVIVLVETRLSMVDLCEISYSNTSKFTGRVASQGGARAGTLEPISFAVRSIHSTMENELEYLGSGALQTPEEHDLEKVIF